MKKEVSRTEFVGGKGLPFKFIVSKSSVPPSMQDSSHMGYYAKIDDEDYRPINFGDFIIEYEDGSFDVEKKISSDSSKKEVLKEEKLSVGVVEDILVDIRSCENVGACTLSQWPEYRLGSYNNVHMEIFPSLTEDENMAHVDEIILRALTAIQLKFHIHITVDIKWPKRIDE